MTDEKKIYHVSIWRIAPLRTYDHLSTAWINSDKDTSEEVREEILEYHKKKGIQDIKKVVVTGPHDF